MVTKVDYNAWLEVFRDGRWFTFDARHNAPRIGRITVARGHDATDIPLVVTLKAFRVWTDEVERDGAGRSHASPGMNAKAFPAN